jgi:MFS family permease
MSAARDAGNRMFAALAVRNFRLYFFGQLVSVSGTWMQSLAQGWLVYRTTHQSGSMLGIAVALQYVPMLVFGSYGGLVADRNDKRRILYVTQTGAGLLALVLGILVTTHHANVPSIFALAFTLGIVNLFDVPARQSFVQEMVGRDLISNAVSLNSVLMNAGRAVGPAIAGGLIATVGVATCFYVNAASYVFVLAALVSMRSSELTPIRRVEREKNQLRLGLAYVRDTPLLRDVLLCTAVVGTFAFNFTVTLQPLAVKTFHEHGAASFSYLLSAMGCGAVLGGLYVAHRSRPTVTLLVTLAGLFGTFMTVVALSPTVLIATIFMVFTGAASIAFVATANALLQLNSQEQIRGRVMSLYSIAFLGSTPVGATIMGLIIDASNPRIGLLTGSVLTLASGLWLTLVLRHKAVSARLALG